MLCLPLWVSMLFWGSDEHERLLMVGLTFEIHVYPVVKCFNMAGSGITGVINLLSTDVTLLPAWYTVCNLNHIKGVMAFVPCALRVNV